MKSYKQLGDAFTAISLEARLALTPADATPHREAIEKRIEELRRASTRPTSSPMADIFGFDPFGG